jgi:Ca2+-binding RTX toxin-like protein
LAHLGKSFTSYQTFLNGAEQIGTVNFTALNGSGVSGTAIVAMDTELDGTRYINVSIFADSMTAEQMHMQHIHGAFDAMGMPANSTTPTLGDDTDGDGFIEVLEGVPAYGDILVSLDENGAPPMANADGEVAYVQSFNLEIPANLLSPVTGMQYAPEDLMPLAFREIVLHGQDVAAGVGDGTPGEVDGTQDGFVGILPVASGEIETTDLETALEVLAAQRAAASDVVGLGDGDDRLDTGVGDDRVSGGPGDDRLSGGGDDDRLAGNSGDDRLEGGDGADMLVGRGGSDRLIGGGGDDMLIGNGGGDWVTGGAGTDRIWGGSGDDVLRGNAVRDIVRGGGGDDALTGGNGNDRLRGGEGADTFVFNDMSEGSDTILDFEAGLDMLAFGNAVMTGGLAFAQDGDDAVLAYGDSMLTVRDTDVGDLSGFLV